jgi:hypothetical protein
MAEKDKRKGSRAVNPLPGDGQDDLERVPPATLGAPTRSREQLAQEVAEFRRNLRRRTNGA